MISIKWLGTVCVVVLGTVFQAQAATPLTLGTTYAGTIALPGQTNSYTFTGVAGQRIFFDALDSDTLQLTVSLFTPGGYNWYQGNDDFDGGPWVLTEPGTYTLMIAAPRSITGNYQFRLLDLSAAPTLTLGSTVSDQLSSPLGCNIYQFKGTQGQRINIQSVSYSTNQALWKLISPANVTLTPSYMQINQSLGTTTLPIDGNYCLLIQGTTAGNTPLTYQILATDVSDVPTSPAGFGATHTGNVSANQTNSFSYTAPAGLTVYFDSLDTSGQSLVVDLMDPTGNAVFSIAEVADSGPYVLPRSGTYTLNVRGPSGGSGNFNFRLLDLSASPALPLNSAVSSSLSAPYQTDVYQLNGTAGQRLYFDSTVTTTENVQVQLLGPDGQSPMSGPYYYDLGPVTLPYSGTYYLFLRSPLASGPTYHFQMIDIGTQAPVPLNTDFTGALSANTALIYNLAGTNGEQLYFYGKSPSSAGAYWSLYDARNVQIGSSSIAGDFEMTLPYTCDYTLVFAAANASATYSNQVRTFTYATNALTLGTVVSNNIVGAGDQVIYTFTGTAGQRIYYDALTSYYPYVNVSLVSPSGVTLTSGNVTADFGPLALSEPGTYQLIFDGLSHNFGPIAFQLLDISAQPALTLNADETGTLPPNEAQLFQINGTPGEQLYFYSKQISAGGATWTLYDPQNTYVASANFGGDFEVTLSQAGTYVAVFAGGSNPVAYSNQVNNFTYTTNALTLGTVVNSAISVPGAQVFYSFSGTTGQRLYYDGIIPLSPPFVTVTLISPTGIQVATGNFGYDFGPVSLPETGTYLLQFDGSGHTTSPISFQLMDISAQPQLPLNTDLLGTLPANATLLYQLSGTAGEQLYFNSKSVSASGAGWFLFGPNNASISGAALSQDFSQILPYTGTYVIALQNSASAAITYSNQVNTFSYVTNSLSLSSETTSAVVHPGDQLFYTFNGVAGQRLYFDSRQTNYVAVVYNLLSPTGVNILTGNASYDSSGTFTLTQTGTYTLVISGSGDTTASVSFNLLDLASATPVNFGSTVTDSLSDLSETRLYRFSGTVGQRVNLQSLGSGGGKATWELIGPQDQVLAGSLYISQNIGTNTLPETGTYTVAVIGNGLAGPSLPYQWTLSNVSDSPVGTTGFGTVQSGTIGANQTNSFTYTASAGLPVYFDSQDTSGQNLAVDLMSPDGTTVFSVVETSDAGPYILPRSGTYTLNVRGYNGNSGNYSFRLLDLSASPVLAFNTAITGTLNNPYETDVLQFSNAPGQVFIYNALTNDANYPSVLVQLLNPAGQSVGPGGDFQVSRFPFNLQYGGTSYFFLRNNKNVAGTYSFQLQDIATEPALPLNVSVTNQLGVYEYLVYHYSGTAGQQLFFHSQPNNPSGNWYVVDPNNSIVSGGGPGLATDFEVTLPFNGMYSVVIVPSGSVPGTEIFQVNGYSYFTNNYTLNTPVVANIGQAGERHFYTFNGTLGQRLVYNALTNEPPYPNRINVQLLNPEGSPEGPIGGTFTSDRGPFSLQESGTYTLVIDGAGASVGTFAFQLLDVSAQPVLPINTPVSNTLDAYAEQVYQYTGTAGQQLYFGGQSGNSSGLWYLYDPNNNYLLNASLINDFEITLPISGTYTLVLTGETGSSAPENFLVNDYSYFTNAYTLGTAVADSIKRPGERHFYTFTGTAGQRLIYDALTNDPLNHITAKLLNPEGAQESTIGGSFANDQGPFTLQESGTYTLQIDGNLAATGPYAFQLLDVLSLPAMPLSNGVTNTLGVYTEQAYQFTGLPGQHLYFQGSQNNASGVWYLYDPNNAQVQNGSASLTGDFDVTLPIAGTYVLSIRSYDTIAKTEVFSINPFNGGETLNINRAPILAFITNQIVGAGVPISFVAQATDPDNNTLTFSLDPGSPAGASINPTTGAFFWNPPVTGLSSVTPVTVRVTDNGNPPLSAAETLTMEVIAGPSMITVQRIGGVANVSWHSAPTKHYRLQYKNNITDPTWLAVGSDLLATDIITIQPDSSIGTNEWRFYRVQALDPLQ